MIEYIVKSKAPEMARLSQLDRGDTFKFQHSSNVYYVVRPGFTPHIAKVGDRNLSIEYHGTSNVIPVQITKIEAEEDWYWTPREGF